MNVEKLNNHRQEWFYFMPGVSCGHDTCSFLYGTLHVLYFLCFFKFQKNFRHWTCTTIIYTWSASDSVSPLMLKTLSLLRLLTWCEYLEVIRWSQVDNFVINVHENDSNTTVILIRQNQNWLFEIRIICSYTNR